MFYAISWFCIVALLALWSLATWALHAAAVWMVSNAGALSGLATGTGDLSLPHWLTPWVPPELVQWASQAVAGLVPLIEGLLQVAPAMAGGLGLAAWVIWGIGSVLLLLVGVVIHLRIAPLLRNGPGPTAGSSTVAGLLR